MVFAVENLSRRLGGRTVLDSVTFQVERGELVSIIGPSGVGKTTLLRILAGLDRPTSGRLLFDTPPTKDRPVIMVFQDYLLFPNMTVFDNTAFGLKSRRTDRRETERRVREILAYFHLEDKADAYPAHLSAGQKQRVAIARAMVVNPAVLLLDEPFANLDPGLKMETAEFIRATQREFGITTVSVTHDLPEAFVMSDRIGIMLGGKLIQYATAGEVYHRPATYEAARFLGPANLIGADLAAALGLPEADAGMTRYVRPEGFVMQGEPNGAGVIREVSFAGHYIRYKVELAGHVLTVYSLSNSLAAGDRVRLAVSPGALLLAGTGA